MTDDAFEQGRAVRTAVLGRKHVERSRQRATPFDAEWQDHLTRHAWAAVWTRPGLDHRMRSMLTIAMLASLGHEEELKLHIRATQNTGVTREEVKEILLHLAVYAGVPAANTAFRVAREAFEDLDREDG